MNSLMGGDVDLFLHCINKYVRKGSDEQETEQMERTTQLARSTFRIMNISQHEFLAEVKDIFKEELGAEEAKEELKEN